MSSLTHQSSLPKALFVDINSSYLNPTRSSIWHLLTAVFDLSFFGPGFSSEELLCQGLSSFIDKHGPFQYIFTTPHIALCSWNSRSIDHDYQRIFYFDFDHHQLAFVPSIRDQLLSFDTTQRIIFALDLDFWNLSQSSIQILDSFSIIFGMGTNLWPTHTSHDVDIWKTKINTNWSQYLMSNPSKVIDFPHFLTPFEFSFANYNYKSPLQWSVPGVLYNNRKRFLDLLKAKKASVSSSSFSRIVSKFRQWGLCSHRDFYLLNLSRHIYRKLITTSNFSYACGSSIGMPLRKFFEIPAFGSLLVCEPIPSLGWLGFKHMQNCVIMDSDNPSATIDLIHSLSETEINNLTHSGQQHVLLNHSTYARSRLLKSSLRI